MKFNSTIFWILFVSCVLCPSYADADTDPKEGQLRCREIKSDELVKCILNKCSTLRQLLMNTTDKRLSRQVNMKGIDLPIVRVKEIVDDSGSVKISLENVTTGTSPIDDNVIPVGYVMKYWEQTKMKEGKLKKLNIPLHTTEFDMKNLMPNTTYEIVVLVQFLMKIDKTNLICIADIFKMNDLERKKIATKGIPTEPKDETEDDHPEEGSDTDRKPAIVAPTPVVLTLNHSDTEGEVKRKFFLVKWGPGGNDDYEDIENRLPEVEESISVMPSTGNTSKITLPTIKNPPAWQYVVVLNYNASLSDDQIQQKSVRLVTEYIKRHRFGNGSHETLKEENRSDGWVAKMINITAVSNDSNNNVFEIGDGQGENKPLETDKNYNVVVVTEKRTGSTSTFTTTDPVNTREMAVASGLLGILFALFVFLIMICLFVWSYKKQQSGNHIIRVPQQNLGHDNL